MSKEKGKAEILFTEKDMLEIAEAESLGPDALGDLSLTTKRFRSVLKYKTPLIHEAIVDCQVMPSKVYGVSFIVWLESEKIQKIGTMHRIVFSKLKELHSTIVCDWCNHCFGDRRSEMECRYFPPQVVADRGSHNSRYPHVGLFVNKPCSKFERSEDSIFRVINILNKGINND